MNVVRADLLSDVEKIITDGGDTFDVASKVISFVRKFDEENK